MKTFMIEVSDPSMLYLAKVVAKRLEDRGMEQSSDAEFTLKVKICAQSRADSYQITGKPTSLTVIADSLINAYAGVGAVLYGSKYDVDGIIPTEARGYTTPDCTMRCVYTATHFHTYYWMAPLDELFDYYDDLALMGINQIHIGQPFFGTADNDRELEEALDRLAEIQHHITSL